MRARIFVTQPVSEHALKRLRGVASVKVFADSSRIIPKRTLIDAVRKAGSAEPSAIQQALTGGLTLEGVGLAERSYQRGGDHDPIAEVAVSKIAAGNFLPLQARLLPSAANG